jgi:hypothetical protein
MVTMRTLMAAAAILALIAAPAHAQSKRPQVDTQQKKKDDRPPVDENAYKAALERIPEPKEKYDPWSITKPAEPAKKPR